ncbi:MAG: hypothetical protein EOM23_10965, partial [Candidatus Moranbacteria bacterium]|nr:hypothetical protein [Candidatus Moranbacteria bacterium]
MPCDNMTYGIDGGQIKATQIKTSAQGIEFDCLNGHIKLGIPGYFSIYNALAAISVAHSIGIEIGSIAAALKEACGVKVETEDERLRKKENAKINHVNNVVFYEDDASDFIEKLEERKQKIDAVFVDPPRKGLDERFIQSLNNLRPERIVYISCDPATLARDVALFNAQYQVSKLVVVDMFSRTYHVESIVLLTRREQ